MTDPIQPPGGGYTVPPPTQVPAGFDPLISPDFAGWWQRTIRLVRLGWRPLLLLHAIGAVVSFAAQAPFALSLNRKLQDLTEQLAEPEPRVEANDLLGLLPAAGAATGGAALVSAFVMIATVWVVVATAAGAPARIGPALGLAVRRILPYLGWQLLAGTLILAGLCACVLPGLYVSAVLLIMPVVIAMERSNAIARCFRFFHGDLGAALGRIATIFGLQVAGSLCATLGGSVLGAVATAVAPAGIEFELSVFLSAAVASVLAGLAAMLLTPLTVTAYADLRARFEPYSTAIAARELGLLDG